MRDVRAELQEIFRQVFDDPTIVLRDDMTAADVEGWDSVTHIDLLIAVERALGIKFATAEMSRLKEPDQNIGSFVRLIEHKLQAG
ncbi:MAG TPA: acyl carrier protein [Planctomycetaceae bacterium]|nr:acyl carrier protein [Planctomycetaceae bacterium]